MDELTKISIASKAILETTHSLIRNPPGENLTLFPVFKSYAVDENATETLRELQELYNKALEIRIQLVRLGVKVVQEKEAETRFRKEIPQGMEATGQTSYRHPT